MNKGQRKLFPANNTGEDHYKLCKEWTLSAVNKEIIILRMIIEIGTALQVVGGCGPVNGVLIVDFQKSM